MEKKTACHEQFCHLQNSKAHKTAGRFRMTEHLLKRVIEKRAASTGVYRSQHSLLMYLFFGTDLSQTELAERMEISPAAVAVTLKKLEKGGFVQRGNRKDDSRVNQVVITEKGKEIIQKSIEIFKEVDECMFEGFSEGEMNILYGYLDRMYANLSQYREDMRKE